MCVGACGNAEYVSLSAWVPPTWAATANRAVAVSVSAQMRSRRKPTQRAVAMTALSGRTREECEGERRET